MLSNDGCLAILRDELKPAFGCTEPIAVAYASACARELLGRFPEGLSIACSGNMLKNTKSVLVPNSNGMHGVEAAAVLGLLANAPDARLELLETLTDADRAEARRLCADGFCTCKLAPGKTGLYILAEARAGDDVALVEIQGAHTNITRMERNGECRVRSTAPDERPVGNDDRQRMTLDSILAFAQSVDVALVEDTLNRQIADNTAICDEGIAKVYGAQVGKTILETRRDTVETRASALAAAGSDARMNGCPLPVVINSGSGNQGITVTLPVVTYAKALGAPRDRLYRALIISNLLSVHIKSFIGSLSAFCGAVSAAAGSAAAIAYLMDGTLAQMSGAAVNVLASVGGIVCDGAKSSCAMKIAMAVDAATLGARMSLEGRQFESGDGIVKNDLEATIRAVGRVGHDGMAQTDLQILDVMLERDEGGKLA